MIVLHALWDVLNSELCVWGESRNLFRPLLRPKDTTKKGQSVGFHPFAVKPRYLKILTTVKLRMRLVGNIGQRVVDLRLPSARGIPLPSPAILTSLPDDKLCSWCEEAKVRFRTWEVGVLVLGGESVLEFLSLLPENPPEGTTYGEDLLFWKNLFKRAVDTVKCRRFVPSVAVGTNNGRFLHAAIWEPIFDYEDNCLLGELSTSMPNACLAFADSDHEEISPLQAVFSFFNWCVDSFIRHSVKEYLPIEETLKHLKGQRVHEQWLKALLRDDPTLSGTDAALRDFDSRIMEWVKKLIESISGANSASSLIQSHFQLCLKLEPLTEEIRMSTDDCCGAEPNVGSGVENRALVARKWRLTYYLQAEDDPSLLIPAEDIWWAQAASTVRRALVSQHREWDQGAKKATNGPTDRGTYQAADAASHRGAYLDEVLLRELAKASRVFRGIEETLKEPCPTGLVLDADELEEFLRKTAPALIEKGIELMLPPWWQKPPAKIGARLRVKEDSSPTTGLLGISSIVNYDWEIAVDDKSLTVEEFLRLARTKLHLVKVRGEWVRFDPNEVDRAVEFFGRRSSGKIRLGEVLSLSLGGEVPGTNIPIEEVRAEGRINDILSTLSSLNGELRMSLQPIPEGFSGQLRPYQTRGFSWLVFLRNLGFGACLADDMGLGKTVEFLAYLLHCVRGKDRGEKRGEEQKSVYESGIYELAATVGPSRESGGIAPQLTEVHDAPGASKHLSECATGAGHDCNEISEQPTSTGPSLLVCPMSVVGNWEKEVRRFVPSLKVIVYHGQKRLSPDEFLNAVKDGHLVITTYGLVYRDRKVLSKIEWDSVVLDEAQNIKNPYAKQTQAVKKLKARHRIALTGTPVENRLSELWSIMDFLNPGYLGSLEEFRKCFIIPVEKHRDLERKQLLVRIIKPFVLRRLKNDPGIVPDLPDKIEMKVYCNLTKEQASLYQAVVDDMMDRIQHASGMERRGLVLSALTKLKQICNHPAHFLKDRTRLDGRSGKLLRLAEMLEEVLEAGEKALVFTQFAEMGLMLQEYLEQKFGCEVLYLHGGTPKRERDRMVERFQEKLQEDLQEDGNASRKGPRIFVLSLKAGGLGLNLTAANHVFHFDRWWNPAIENQATDRAFRIGQWKNVQVRKLITVGTLEERIDEIIERKKDLAESVVGSGETWLTELSTEELREIFSLNRDAVVEV